MSLKTIVQAHPDLRQVVPVVISLVSVNGCTFTVGLPTYLTTTQEQVG
ncbi:MAG: hypothetical protein ACP5CD_05200 [Thermovirgaceae bacterium]